MLASFEFHVFPDVRLALTLGAGPFFPEVLHEIFQVLEAKDSLINLLPIKRLTKTPAQSCQFQ